MTNYIIVSACDQDDLVELVRAAIKAGWQPLGGVSVACMVEPQPNDHKGYHRDAIETYIFDQALIK